MVEHIEDLSQFVKLVCKLNFDFCKEQHFTHKALLFRGQSNKEYELLPSIARDRRSDLDYTIFNEERNLVEMAKNRLPDVFCRDLLPIELLSLLQHYGILTRLLDVSENSLVALYFACCDNPDDDGEVIVFKNEERHLSVYPIINAIADSYRFAEDCISLEYYFENVREQSYFTEQKQLGNIIHENSEGELWLKSLCEKIIYVHAPIRSPRQQAQQGKYILFPNRVETIDGKARFQSIIDPIPKNHKDILCRIIIPKEQKNRFLQDLSILGISKPTLFCDSIDVVCQGIVKRCENRLF